MQKKTFIYVFFLILSVTAVTTGAYAAWPIRLAVSPPATSAWDLSNGTARDITGVLPADFKECNQENIGYGYYSNRILVKGNNGNRYRIKISISGDLISGIHTIDSTKYLKWLLTYNNGSGESFAPDKYTAFPLAPTDIYRSILEEGLPNDASGGPEREFQFKYAIQVPDNAYQGVYTATITYLMEEEISGLTISKTCAIRVTVGSYFRLSIDRGAIDFEKMSKGETRDNVPVEGVIITSKTNTENPWYLKISNDNPLSNGPYIIPNSSFIWYGYTEGKGTWYGGGTDQMSPSPMLAYAGSPDEYNSMPSGVKNHLKFKLSIPKDQPGGKYITTVRMTMTE